MNVDMNMSSKPHLKNKNTSKEVHKYRFIISITHCLCQILHSTNTGAHIA